MRRQLHRSEAGIALPLVTLVLSLVLSLGAVAVTQAITAADTANRDVLVRKASQASQAGLDTAAYRMNALSLDLSSLLDITRGGNPLKKQCLVSTGSVIGIGALSNLGSWCPISEPEPLGNGAWFQYQISPVAKVSTGSQQDRNQCYRLLSLATCGPLLALPLYKVDGLTNLDLSREIVAIGKAGPDCATTASGTDGSRCVKRRLYSRYRSDGNEAAVSQQDPGLGGLVGGLLQTLVRGLLTSPGGDLRAELQIYVRDANSFRECTAAAPSGSPTPAGGC